MRIKFIIPILFSIIITGCNLSNKKTEYVLKSGDILDMNGHKVASTIDNRLQSYVDSLLKANISYHLAESGCAVVMETQTGAIKAIVNLIRNEDGSYILDSNLAINHMYEHGSLFKLYSAMALIEDKSISLDDSVLINYGKSFIGGAEIVDNHIGPYQKMTFRDGFAFSSNVVFSRLVYENFRDNPDNYLSGFYKLKLNQPLPLDIKQYNSQILKKPGVKDWNDTALQFMAIGYGVYLSPLHMLTFYNAIANNGIMVYPYFLPESKGKQQGIKTCKTETAFALKNMLQDPVKYGTAHNLYDSMVPISGKTGTIQVMTGNSVDFVASFIGCFPADNPKYTCIVMINKPRNGLFYGSIVAGPVVKQIAEFIE